jgi:dihydrofolate reductase
VRVAHSVDEALQLAAGEIFVAGGGEIYAQTLDRADRLYLTHVHAEFPGDARFPAVDAARWQILER